MQSNHSFQLNIKWIIIVTSVLRSIIACFVELGNDEVYYFTYAVQPDWNHFDHPPLVGLFIRLFTLNLHWINDLTLRLPAIIGAALNTWLIARCGCLIENKRTGLIAVILYNTSLYTSIISGLFILPDSVQLVFWMTALYSMLKILSAQTNADQNKHILLMGIWIGLAILCKVHGVFLWLGILGYVLIYQRALLKNPRLYISFALTLLIISPILIWNISNEFISWQFHSERVGADRINIGSFLKTTAGQIAYNNPVHVWLFIITIINIRSKKYFLETRYLRLLLWCSLPIILLTMLASLFRPALPHWSGPGFLGLMLLSGAFIDSKLAYAKKMYTGLLKSSAVLIIVIIIAGVSLINFYPGTLNEKPEPKTGTGDFTLDMYGWKNFSNEFKKLRQNDLRTGRMSKDAPLIVQKWFPGGHLFYYLAYPMRISFVGLGSLNDLHKFVWLNEMQQPVKTGAEAYFITASNNFTDPNDIYGNAFTLIEKPSRITQQRNGRVARYWYVYRLRGAKKL